MNMNWLYVGRHRWQEPPACSYPNEPNHDHDECERRITEARLLASRHLVEAISE